MTRIAWDSQPLGRITDYALARRLGVDSSTVWSARRTRGIPACLSIRIDWGTVPDLGRVTDGELARRYGVSPSVVCGARRRRGIPPAPVTMAPAHPAPVRATVLDSVSRVLAAGPSSWRAVHAAVVAISGRAYNPRTTLRALRRLEAEGAVTAHRVGDARRWTYALAVDRLRQGVLPLGSP